jgi:hypothetical protein
VPSSSFGLANTITTYFFIDFTVAPLRAVVSSISPHRCTPLDDIIFYSAPLAILSSILPHGRAPLAILFSIEPNSHAILAKYFFIRPYGCTSPGKILLITHQGFLRVAICSCPGTHSYLILQSFCPLALVLLLLWHHATNSLLHPFWCSLKAPFIGVGVAFLAMLGDKQPSRPFWRSLTWMMGHALASDDPIKNSIDTLISEGCLLSWYIVDIHNRPTELTLSKSF